MNEHRRATRPDGPPQPKPAPPVGPPQTRPIPIPQASEGRAEEQGARRSGRGRSGRGQGVRGEGAATEQQNGDGQRQRGRARRARRRRRRGAPRIPDRPIVFVGPMAAGKTSLGKRVARELGVPFVDTDASFVRAHGVITEFFAARGEAEFRRIEAEIIADELAKPGCRVVALGGGAVITESTRELLAGFPVVLLMTTQEAVLRTANLSRRPLLRDDPQAWGRILRERKPFYDAVADVTFRTDRATKEQLARRVSDWARTFRKRSQA